MSKIYAHFVGGGGGGGGVILYRVQSFLFPQIDLNFGHLFSCDNIGGACDLVQRAAQHNFVSRHILTPVSIMNKERKTT